MKKLLLILIMLPSLILSQSKTVKVRDKTIGSSTYGETSTFEVTEQKPMGSFGNESDNYIKSLNKQTEELQRQTEELERQSNESFNQSIDKLSSAIGKAYADKYGEQLRIQKAREGINYLGNGKYELIEVLATGFTGVKGSVKRANKTLLKFVENTNYSNDSKYSVKKFSEEGKKGGMGVYSEAVIVFELIDSDGNTFIDEEQEDILKNEKEQEKSELRKITKEDALAKLKEYKEQLELELITQEQYDKYKSELAPKILGN